MAYQTVTATEGDTGRVVGVTLYDDGVAVDLSTADTIVCHVKDKNSATVTDYTVTGDTAGVINTTLTAALATGDYWLEWDVTFTTGTTVITYPSDEDDRVELIVRAAND